MRKCEVCGTKDNLTPVFTKVIQETETRRRVVDVSVLCEKCYEQEKQEGRIVRLVLPVGGKSW